MGAACYAWKAHQAIAEMLAQNRPGARSNFKRWLEIDPWAKQVWAPHNADWESFTEIPTPVFSIDGKTSDCVHPS